MYQRQYRGDSNNRRDSTTEWTKQSTKRKKTSERGRKKSRKQFPLEKPDGVLVINFLLGLPELAV